MEEAALLHAVQWDIGVVEIEHDLARRAVMRFEEDIDQQRIDLRSVAIDLVVSFVPWRFGVCSRRFSVLLPANASQSERNTGASFPASAVNVGSLRSSSWSLRSS